MKIKLKDLKPNQPTSIEIRGDEGWLGEIYALFPPPKGKKPPRLSGSLAVRQLQPDVIQVRGRIEYSPFVTCSRCPDMIAWPIEADLDVLFQPVPEHLTAAKEVQLSRTELDEYYIEDGAIDLEVLINDTVNLAIPTKTVRLCADGKTCAVCGEDVSGDCVTTTDASGKTSPFAKLKDLRVGK